MTDTEEEILKISRGFPVNTLHPERYRLKAEP